MQPTVAGQLGMERRRPSTGALAGTSTGHRPVERRPAPRPGAGALDHRGPDEHRVERRPSRPATSRSPSKRVDLAAVAVAAHGQVDGPEAALVGPAVEHRRWPAGSCRRTCRTPGRPSARRVGQRVEQARRVEQQRHGGRLAAGHHQAVERRPGRRACAPRRTVAPSSARAPTCARTSPWRASTPMRRRHLAASARSARAAVTSHARPDARRASSISWPAMASPRPAADLGQDVRRRVKWAVASTMAWATRRRVRRS